MVRAHAGPLIENEALTCIVSAFLFSQIPYCITVSLHITCEMPGNDFS